MYRIKGPGQEHGRRITLPWGPDKRIDIEMLVRWAFGDQKADRIIDAGAGLFEGELAAANIRRQGRSRDGTGVAAEIAVLGAVIRTSQDSGEVHEVAQTVNDHVATLPDTMSKLVVGYGRAKSRPDWGEAARTRLVPLYWDSRRRRAMIDYDEETGATYCAVYLVDGPDEVNARRQIYELWHSALVYLAGKRYPAGLVVTAPEVAARPWREKFKVKNSSRL
ncbi:MAG: hypothetical protein MI755_16430 [Sphingomonadales bacterium]|nr:hypothetical protein [Sphingomonadales bacterium]